MRVRNNFVPLKHSVMGEDPENPNANREESDSVNKRLQRKASEWINMFFITSVVGVLVDPLFFYIPFIDEENKCIGMDTKLRNAALLLRLLMDAPTILCFLLGFLFYLLTGGISSVSTKNAFLTCVVIYAFLPIPQVAILIGFYRMRGFGNPHATMFLNVLLLLQHAVRVYWSHSLSKDLKYSTKRVKGAFNVFAYILGSNVLGAMVYFFSIQREALCWHQACRNTPGCTATFYCGDTRATTSTNTTFLNESCPINPSNSTVFDFGIYLIPLQSGNTGQVKFTVKLFYFFWWGIKNLSNFGTNLDTSSYVWENCFAILICLVGLLIFLYLIGNVQTYMQMQTTKDEELKGFQPKIEKNKKMIELWFAKHVKEECPFFLRRGRIQRRIIRSFNKKVNDNPGEDVVVDLKYVLSLVDQETREHLQKKLILPALHKVPMIGKKSGAFEIFSKHVEPMVYAKNSYIVREGEPLVAMLFIVDGTAWTYNTTTSDGDTNTGVVVAVSKKAMTPMMTTIKLLEKDDFYGEELLSLALPENSFSHIPISTNNVRCHTKVEALVLTIDSWRALVQEYVGLRGINIYEDSDEQLRQELAPPCYEVDQIETEINPKNKIAKFENDILEWATRNSLPEDIKTQISNSLKQNNVTMEKNAGANVDLDLLFSILPWHVKRSVKRHLGMNALKKVPMLQNMDQHLLELVCNQLEPVIYNEGSYVVGKGEPLDLMLFIVEGEITWIDAIHEAATTTTRNFSSMTTKTSVVKGDYYGEELLSWASLPNSSLRELSTSTRDVKCKTKVEAFALMAEDLRSIIQMQSSLGF